METLSVRLLPYAAADGPRNMAADEALLESAVRGTASLRFYGWSEPTLSLGYFQPAALRVQNPHGATLPFVRRPSGGDAIVHHFELTYALALPPGPAGHGGDPWLILMHRRIAAALTRLGVSVDLHATGAPATDPLLCFAHPTSGDVMFGTNKVVGSAQRRRRGALLQHGSILMRRSPFAPQLLGIQDLSAVQVDQERIQAVVCGELAQHLGWQLISDDWMRFEQGVAGELSVRRYTQDSWNLKR